MIWFSSVSTGDVEDVDAVDTVNADSGVHPDLLNSRFGYVAISRASHEATVFTNDAANLSQQLGAEVSKTSALEITRAGIAGNDLGL